MRGQSEDQGRATLTYLEMFVPSDHPAPTHQAHRRPGARQSLPALRRSLQRVRATVDSARDAAQVDTPHRLLLDS